MCPYRKCLRFEFNEMFRRIQQSFALIVGVMSSSCSETEVVAPSPLACYTVTLGAWSSALPEELPPPPSAVQLTDSLGTQVLENGRRVVRSMPRGTVKSYPFQYWVPREEGDVLIVFSNGFTGMTMDLSPAGVNLSGTARAFFDFGSYDLTAPVQLQRGSCTDP
jgi:hypothetical protein